MNPELSRFAARLRGMIDTHNFIAGEPAWAARFAPFALELFALQFRHNAAYRRICESRQRTPPVVEHWTQIPAVPTSAFKQLELTSLPPPERTKVFHSSGTTEQTPSRHFHCAESLALYESSLGTWFAANFQFSASTPSALDKSAIGNRHLAILTPPPAQAPHSSLVHMFETLRQRLNAPESAFVGDTSTDGAWTLNLDAVLAALNSPLVTRHPSLILGTAFSFVHLLDYLAGKNVSFQLPPGSRVLETGGYKNRSRVLPKTELHQLITKHLGVPRENIVCEYGMSELSSQAYDVTNDKWQATRGVDTSRITHHASRFFRFPPWARVQIISPETGREVADGETGLIRVFDLANVFSVAAIQTEDLGIRRGEGFELIGRTQAAEPRGCSLMTA
jgi:hypothetical protein